MNKKQIVSCFLACILFIICFMGTASAAYYVECPSAYKEGWYWPVPATRHLSRGYRLSYTQNNTTYSEHLGIDIAPGAAGDEVRATKSGTVVAVFDGCKNYNAASTKKNCKDAGCACKGLYTFSKYGITVCNSGSLGY